MIQPATYKLQNTNRYGIFYIPARIIDTLTAVTLYNSQWRPNTKHLFWTMNKTSINAYYEMEHINKPIIAINKIGNNSINIPEFYKANVISGTLIIQDRKRYYYQFKLRGSDNARGTETTATDKDTSTNRNNHTNTTNRAETTKDIHRIPNIPRSTKKPLRKNNNKPNGKPTSTTRKQTRTNDRQTRHTINTI
jgi:hypothetical protein